MGNRGGSGTIDQSSMAKWAWGMGQIGQPGTSPTGVPHPLWLPCPNGQSSVPIPGRPIVCHTPPPPFTPTSTTTQAQALKMRPSSLGALLVGLAAWGAAAQGRRGAKTYLPKNAFSCEKATTTRNPGRHCKYCNAEAVVGANERISIQAGGCGNQPLRQVADFTPDGTQFFQPIEATRMKVGTLEVTDVLLPSVLEAFTVGTLTVGTLEVVGTDVRTSGVGRDGRRLAPPAPPPTPTGGPANCKINAQCQELVIGAATTTVTIPGNLLVSGSIIYNNTETFNAGIRTNTIAPATGSTVTINGNLAVTGSFIRSGLETFDGGIATNSVVPATGTSLTLGNMSTTVSVPGRLDVTGETTLTALATFNAGIRTNTITPFTATSVDIPGIGIQSVQIGNSGACRDIKDTFWVIICTYDTNPACLVFFIYRQRKRLRITARRWGMPVSNLGGMEGVHDVPGESTARHARYANRCLSCCSRLPIGEATGQLSTALGAGGK